MALSKVILMIFFLLFMFVPFRTINGLSIGDPGITFPGWQTATPQFEIFFSRNILQGIIVSVNELGG